MPEGGEPSTPSGGRTAPLPQLSVVVPCRNEAQTLPELVARLRSVLDGVPEATIASFAGTGNPFSLGALGPGERVVDVGSGGGIDSLIAARMVGASGRVIGIDMTPAMLEKARTKRQRGGNDQC